MLYYIGSRLMRLGAYFKRLHINHPIVDNVIAWVLISAGVCGSVWMLMFIVGGLIR